jgi:hypothetical protein
MVKNASRNGRQIDALVFSASIVGLFRSMAPILNYLQSR